MNWPSVIDFTFYAGFYIAAISFAVLIGWQVSELIIKWMDERGNDG